MVDFRYHLVSIIAVFLALALGIVVGTTALNGVLLNDLQRNVRTLTADKRDLETTVNGLRDQSASDQQLFDLTGPNAVRGQLQGERIVVLIAPGATIGVPVDLLALLTAAGATVTGTVQLRPDLLDPGRAAALDDLLARLAPPVASLSGDRPMDRAADELAAALVRGPEALPPEQAAAVLDGFAEQDLIDVQGDLSRKATLALVLVGPPVVGADLTGAAARVSALLQIARQLDQDGAGTVVSGPVTAASEGGVLKALRDDSGLSAAVSSVDGVDLARGRLATVLALREQLRGDTGSYGNGPGKQGPAPSLPPS